MLRRHARLSDPDLVAACVAGDASAWDALLERYEALVFTSLLRAGLERDEAGDVFQEVCLLLFNHLDQLRDSRRLSGWLLSTAKREAWRVLRRRRPLLLSEMDDPERQMEAAPGLSAAPPLPEDALLALEEQHLVRLAMTRLNTRCRDLLSLLYVADPAASYAEVARQLQMPLGSIGPQRARCLVQLQKLLATLDF